MTYQEVNFDGIVGPSHNYAGLSAGNLASEWHQGHPSSPKQAALQGLEKMWLLHGLGIPQAILPPHLRPHLSLLRVSGFVGTDNQILEKAYQQAPALLTACYSASSMWAANSATITSSADSADGKVQITPANLVFNLHRSLETAFTQTLLKRIFNHSGCFNHHPPLPPCIDFGDEGAANHTRLCPDHGLLGITLLTYGQQTGGPNPKRYPARHTRLTAETIQRSHQLNRHNSLLLQQRPDSIDQGVFHNDVICVGHRNLLLLHEKTWRGQSQQLDKLKYLWGDRGDLFIEQIDDTQLGITQAVSSYLFNSQLLTLPDHSMLMVAPQECKELAAAHCVIQQLISKDNPLSQVRFVDLRESMSNGGGPACLRLRVPLSDNELNAIHQNVILTPALYQALKVWIKQYYRDRLEPSDLRDPSLLCEIRTALEALEQILNLPGLYSL